MKTEVERRHRRGAIARSMALLVAALLIGACGGPSGTTPGTSPTAPAATGSSLDPSPSTPGSEATPSPTPPSGAGRIAFVRFDSAFGFFTAWTMDPDGGNARRLIRGHYGTLPRWSASGDTLAMNYSGQGDKRFATIIPEEIDAFKVLNQPDGELNLNCAAWSPDGAKLACEGWSSAKVGREGVYLIDAAAGGTAVKITSPTGGIHDIPGDYSPDGSKIVFVRATYTPLRLGEVWICDADGKNPRKLTDTLTAFHVSWSPDGRRIAGDADGSLLIFELDNLTADPGRITIAGGKASQPRWSPDGQRIVFQFAKTGSSNSQIYSVAVDGTDVRILTSGNKDNSPDWGVPGF